MVKRVGGRGGVGEGDDSLLELLMRWYSRGGFCIVLFSTS